MMKKEPGGFNKLESYIALQLTKLALALDTIENIATLGAERSVAGKKSIPIEELVSILDEFVGRMEELCSEPAS